MIRFGLFCPRYLKNPKKYEDFVSTSNVMGKEVAHSELLELYGVVRNIPLYVDSFKAYYDNVINALGSIDITGASNMLAKYELELKEINDRNKKKN